jgi:sarcosine oxidase subunit gamma
MSSITPAQVTRRSQLARRHIELGAEFEHNNGLIVVKDYGSKTELTQAKELALADLSTLPRTGFKGAGAPNWAAAQGVTLPQQPNTCAVQSDASLVAKLSYQELLILSDLNATSTQIEHLNNLPLGVQTYALPRADSHCWLAVTGGQAAEMFSKICGVDLRAHKFANGEVAQTSVAKANSIVIRHDLGSTHCFYILTDVSTAEFLWDCLLDAMAEYRGKPVGVAALRALG